LKGFNDLIEDAEWLLERTSTKINGFIIRPIRNGDGEGLWIGEYIANKITREEKIYDENARKIRKIIEEYDAEGEEDIKNKIGIDLLREELKSKIVQDFRYFWCPEKREILKCPNIETIRNKVRGETKKSDGTIRDFEIAGIINDVNKNNPCPHTNMYCPLRDPNEFNRVINYERMVRKYHNDKIKLI